MPICFEDGFSLNDVDVVMGESPHVCILICLNVDEICLE